jgi:DNA-binding transcriptional MerR regulator
MKYNTSDFSRILGVSGNTIRRYDEMGYLTGNRNESSGYREFDSCDLAKLMYITKYRKEELSHEEVETLLSSPAGTVADLLEEKRRQIREKLDYYSAIDHLLKDDIMMMRRAEQKLGRLNEIESQPIHYILYLDRGNLVRDRETEKRLQQFMTGCPEFYYFYFFHRDEVEKGRIVRSEGVGSNIIMTEKYKSLTTTPVRMYEQHPCIQHFIKIPMEKLKNPVENDPELWVELFGSALDYIGKKGMKLTDDIMTLKIGCFMEKGQLMEYLVMHFPVG